MYTVYMYVKSIGSWCFGRTSLVSFSDPTLEEEKGLGTSEHIFGLVGSGRMYQQIYTLDMIGQWCTWAILTCTCICYAFWGGVWG